jgi:predicted ATPase
MITQLNIQNFKAHKQTDLRLTSLTILTGVNGMGKSSILQALLLLRQSYQKNNLQHSLILNGVFCNISTAYDAFWENADTDEGISFELSDGTNTLNVMAVYESYKSNDTILALKTPINSEIIPKFNVFTKKFQYLSAERLAPQESYKRDTHIVEYLGQISDERGRGEMVAHFLAHYGKNDIPIAALKYPNSKYNDIFSQVNAWLSDITPNTEVQVKNLKSNFDLFFRFEKGRDFRAENVGFGLSYALPIVVALLSAEPDSLILIENPEAHLHPKGQSKLAQLMALAAQNGVQIIVETHSDHILNGAAVMVAKGEVQPETVISYHIHRKNTERFSTAYPVPMLPNGQWSEGKLKEAKVKGFFDQILIDNAIILGL